MRLRAGLTPGQLADGLASRDASRYGDGERLFPALAQRGEKCRAHLAMEPQALVQIIDGGPRQIGMTVVERRAEEPKRRTTDCRDV
jgi:hypothetical protein